MKMLPFQTRNNAAVEQDSTFSVSHGTTHDRADHDPGCRWKPGVLSFCDCTIIALTRAEEWERAATYWNNAAVERFADLRANVEGMPSTRLPFHALSCRWRAGGMCDCGRPTPDVWVRRDVVLALIDEAAK